MIKNKIVYVVILGFISIFAILYDNYFTGILAVTMVCLPIVLFAILELSYKRIGVELVKDKDIISQDELLTIKIKFTNRSIFPFNRIFMPIQYLNSITGVKKERIIELAIDQKCSQTICFNFQSSHCGKIHIEIKKVILFDILHIWKKRKKVSINKVITVVPPNKEIDLGEINQIFLQNYYVESDNYSKDKKGDDPSEVFEIREYRKGDRPNRIHWKLSQRLEQLMIKEFSNPILDSVAVLLYPLCIENGEERLRQMDLLLEVIIGLPHQLFLNEKPTHLLWFDEKVKEYKEYVLSMEDDKYSAISNLLNSPVLTEQKRIIKEFTELNKKKYSEMIFVTTEINKENIEDLIEASKILPCFLIYVNNIKKNKLSEDVKKELDHNQIYYLELDENSISTV